jgi:hypothetical protein
MVFVQVLQISVLNKLDFNFLSVALHKRGFRVYTQDNLKLYPRNRGGQMVKQYENLLTKTLNKAQVENLKRKESYKSIVPCSDRVNKSIELTKEN